MSTKPWEEEWTHGKRGHEMRVFRSAGAGDPVLERNLAMVYTPSLHCEEGIRNWTDADNAAEARARIMAAAPAMARALLDILNNYECGEKVDALCRAALAKAGVL